MTDRSEEAKNNFLNGKNCAQSVLCAFCDRCGLDRNTAMKLASGFGAGIARQREVCGAISGMCMAADLIRGPGEGTDKAAKDEHYAFIRGLCDAFRDETGSFICRELLGLAPKQADPPVSEARTAAYYKKRPCADLVALAAKILSEKLS
ncbi:MAG: C_GCAxxG_C_C family protein [Lentisphaeria bacterium]|nr:C_GCAxxG_C_C family protein [Lentisphaeria bacterium]